MVVQGFFFVLLSLSKTAHGQKFHPKQYDTDENVVDMSLIHSWYVRPVADARLLGHSQIPVL